MARLTSTPRSSESNNSIHISTNLLVECRVREHLHSAGGLLWTLWLDSRLLGNESRQALQVTATLVVLRLCKTLAIEPFQRREALNAILLAQLLLAVGVNFGDCDLVFGEFEG